MKIALYQSKRKIQTVAAKQRQGPHQDFHQKLTTNTVTHSSANRDHRCLRVHITLEFHDLPNFFHFWYSKTTILSKNKNAFKFKQFNLKAEI